MRGQLEAFNSPDSGRGELERDEDGPLSAIYIFKLFLAKEKAIFRTINMMRLKPGAEQFVGYFWCPSVERPQIEKISNDSRFANAIEPITEENNHKIIPPTYIPTTDVTWLQQTLVNLYGIPAYKEANPMIISLVTFPFLFGMMFGDLGHGSLVGMIGLMAVIQGEKGPLALGRYPLFLMGIFAMWAGFIYNEVFALPIQMFSSCYTMTDDNTLSGTTEFKTIRWTASQSGVSHVDDNESKYTVSRVNSDCTYIMGSDPVWGITSNKLSMSNGVKMKMSVVFGVLHMMIGVLHKFTNTIYHGHYAHMITECIGGSIILLGLFGWMDFLVFQKWTTPLDIEDRNPASFIAPYNSVTLSGDGTDAKPYVRQCDVTRMEPSLLTQEEACPCWDITDGKT